MFERLELRRLRREHTTLKAENDRTFWAVYDSLPEGREWKSRIRRTIEICRVDDYFGVEKDLWRRIGVLEGRFA